MTNKIKDALEKALTALTDAAPMIDVIRGEWEPENAWTEWDQGVRDKITDALKACYAARASIEQTLAQPVGEENPFFNAMRCSMPDVQLVEIKSYSDECKEQRNLLAIDAWYRKYKDEITKLIRAASRPAVDGEVLGKIRENVMFSRNNWADGKTVRHELDQALSRIDILLKTLTGEKT